MTRLTIGTFTPSFLIELARRDGRFASAGLEVVEESVTSSPQQFRSLAGGEYDVIFTNPDNVIAYEFLSDNPLGETMALRVMAGIDRGLGLGLFRGPEVADPVHAGRLGVDVAGSGFAFVAYEILARHGVALDEVTIATLGATPRRVESLVAGGCDYTILNAGNDLRAIAQGCAPVGVVAEVGAYLGTVLATLRTANPQALDAQSRLREVMRATIDDVLSHRRDDDVVAVVRPLLDLDEDAARQHLDCIHEPSTGLVAHAIVDRASIATIIALRRRHRPSDQLDAVLASLSTFIDSEVLV
ncbi:MAG: hypothetical protein HIU57_01725 [Acidobacteria bacterium]|nr:hypothetical protein [Acidobacteriota bacterium]